MKVEFQVKDKPVLSHPILVCGLPGSAFVGKLAVDHLISELNAKSLADFFCDGFPPQVLIREDGTVSLIKNELFYWKQLESGRSDLILYTGDSQPTSSESEYALAEAIIDFVAKEHGTEEIVTLGAFVTGNFSDRPKVYAAATEDRLAKTMIESGCSIMNDGLITGMNGLVLGMAKLRGMKGYTLLGETSGYVFDPRASEKVLTSLSKITGVSVSTKRLLERAKEAEAVLRTIEGMKRQQQPGGEQQAERKRLDYIS